MVDDSRMHHVTYFSVYTMSKEVYRGPLVKIARQNKHWLTSWLVHCVNLSNCLPSTSKGEHLWIDWNSICNIVFLRIKLQPYICLNVFIIILLPSVPSRKRICNFPTSVFSFACCCLETDGGYFHWV